MEDFSNYIKKEIRDGAIEIEYDGYIHNLHPTKKLYVKCKIETNSNSDKHVLIEIPPLSEKLVMSHNCGPVLENEIDFKIEKIFLKNPKASDLKGID